MIRGIVPEPRWAAVPPDSRYRLALPRCHSLRLALSLPKFISWRCHWIGLLIFL